MFRRICLFQPSSRRQWNCEAKHRKVSRYRSSHDGKQPNPASWKSEPGFVLGRSDGLSDGRLRLEAMDHEPA